MKTKIKLGYELKTGKEVSISPSHLIVTGVTQQSGKTTTLESLIARSGLKAIVFRTKIGEKSFVKGTIIPPYFKDRSDWQFIQGLVEATIKEKLRSFERAKIIQICKLTGGKSLLEFKKKVDERLEEPKLSGFEKDILTNLQAYLEIVLPKLQSITFSNDLELVQGVNIINLERFSRDSEVQSLIIRSVADEVLNNHKGVILVIPEAWKFLPQKRGNPCKLAIEEFIRQGATNENYIWIDSQDMANVDKVPLKQIYNWILGFQSEINEVKHTLAQIPLPSNKKPKADEIMTLGLGQFILATREQNAKVYVQPFWLDNATAKKVAMGKIKVSELDAPENIAPFKVAIKKPETINEAPTIDFNETTKRFQKELNEMGQDFFNKIEDIQVQINKTHEQIYLLKNVPKTEIDEDTLVRKILQKVPVNSSSASVPQFNKDEIIAEVLKKVPTSAGAVTYEVAPLEKIKKDFLEEAKNHVLSKISELDDEEKKMLKFIESQGKGCSQTMLIDKCLKQSATSGGTRNKVSKKTSNMALLLVVKKDKNAVIYPNLKELISSYMGTHEATSPEIESVYNHILMEMLK